jgi:hypothetical protein
MAEKSYAEQIAEYRANRHERESAERLREIEQEYGSIVAQRDQTPDGDTDTFDFYDRQLEELEAEYSGLVPQQAPTPAYTDVEADTARQYSPQQYAQPSWIMQSKYDTGPRATNAQIVQSGAQYAQARFIQERQQRGLQTTPQDLETFRNSPAYKEALEVFAPPEANGLPTADSIVDDIRKTSKYGRDFDAKKYNREVRQMDKLNKRGEYDQ